MELAGLKLSEEGNVERLEKAVEVRLCGNTPMGGPGKDEHLWCQEGRQGAEGGLRPEDTLLGLAREVPMTLELGQSPNPG